MIPFVLAIRGAILYIAQYIQRLRFEFDTFDYLVQQPRLSGLTRTRSLQASRSFEAAVQDTVIILPQLPRQLRDVSSVVFSK